jgi:hypothetical protein
MSCDNSDREKYENINGLFEPNITENVRLPFRVVFG